MKERNPIAVFFLSIITIGIYVIVWDVKTKNEMNKLGADIPTAWLIIVPIANLYWLYKYCEGVDKVTDGKISTVLAFVLRYLLSIIGMAILQNEFNKLGGSPAGGVAVPATAGQAVMPAPDNSFGGPQPSDPSQPTQPPAGPVAPAA